MDDGEPLPPLRLLHPESSLGAWHRERLRGFSTEAIVESLRAGKDSQLQYLRHLDWSLEQVARNLDPR